MLTTTGTDEVALDDDADFDEDAEELEGFGLADEEAEPGQSDLMGSSDDAYWDEEK